MTLMLDGWSAHDIVGPLNKQEIHATLSNYDIPKKSF
jgi:hypothetical protein